MAALFGCTTTQYRLDGGVGSDAGGPMGVLTLESASSFALRFGEQVDIEVRYTELGAPVPGVPIRFALEGRAHDSAVADLSVETDADGRARTRVIAGSTASAFRVRVSAERAAPLYVNVSVGNEGFGTIVVRAEYDGARTEPLRRIIEVYSRMSCSDERPPFPDISAVLDEPSVLEARFRTLPAGITYAIFGRVEGRAGVVLARACADGVSVVRDEETLVDLQFDDEPLVLEGEYAARLSLDAAASSTWAADLAHAAVTDAIGAAGGAAALYLDALDAELRDRGETVAADALASERASGVPEAALQASLEEAESDPAAALAAHIDALGARIAAIEIGGPLSLSVVDGAPVATWSASELSLGMSAPDWPALTIDPAAAGLVLEPALALSGPAGDTLALESLGFSLPFGALARAAIDAETSARGVASPGELLASGAGCTAFAAWIADDPIVGPACVDDCPRAACVRALDGLVEAALSAIETSASPRRSVELSGSIAMLDENGDLVVDVLSAGALSGTYVGSDGEGDPVGAVLRAMRSPE